jgi:hypothetical protein
MQQLKAIFEDLTVQFEDNLALIQFCAATIIKESGQIDRQ